VRDLSKVLLVGGATRSPVIHQLLLESLGRHPRSEVNPDLIVALGASVCAATIAGEPSHAILVDIAAHTLSLSVLYRLGSGPELRCSPIIRRNTPLPATKSEIFRTVYDDQEAVDVRVYEGEGIYPDENTLIGKFIVSGLAKVPEGNPLVVTLSLDLSGLLKVTAMEKITGLTKTVTMDIHDKDAAFDLESARLNVQSLLEGKPADQLSLPQKAATGAGAIAEDPSTQALLSESNDLKPRAEALLAGTLSPEDAADVREHLLQSAEAISEGNWQKLKEHTDALSDLVFYLED
jgi:molecular chaperone DnaK